MTKPLLKIEHLSVGFSWKDSKKTHSIMAVDEVSFQIKTQSFVSLIGRSGSGKSVTAMSLCSLLQGKPKVTGHVYWQLSQGEMTDLFLLNEKKLAQIRGKEISYVFQDPASSWNPVFTIGQQMTDALKAHEQLSDKEALSIVKNTLSEVGFKDAQRIQASYPHQLSGGMKQRAMIAQAIALRSKLIIADEPTSALDEDSSEQILALLQGLTKNRSTSVLFITHDIVLASKYSSEMLVMEKGCLVERLLKSEGGFSPEHPWSRSLFDLDLENYKSKEMIRVFGAD